MDVPTALSPYFGQADSPLPENPLVALKRKIKEEPEEVNSNSCPLSTSIPENPLVALKRSVERPDEPKRNGGCEQEVSQASCEEFPNMFPKEEIIQKPFIKEEFPQTPKKVKQEKITDHLIVKKKRDRFKGMTEEEVMARLLPDHLAPNLDIVIVGINPGLFAAHVGHHYAGPGNHFYQRDKSPGCAAFKRKLTSFPSLSLLSQLHLPEIQQKGKCLSLSGLTPTLMTGYDDFKMLEHGIGFTNICSRTTKGSADLTKKEIKEGAVILKEKILKYKPKIVVFNGKGIYEVFIGHKNFHFGKQPDPLETTNTIVFVMPSSSARCSQLPRAVDKVPFYVALKKLRDHLKGDLPDLDESEVCFPDLELKTAKSEKTESGGTEVKKKGTRGRKKKQPNPTPYPIGQHWMNHENNMKPFFPGMIPNCAASSQPNYNYPVTTYPTTTTGNMFNPLGQPMTGNPFGVHIKQEARTDDQSYGCMSKNTDFQAMHGTYPGQYSANSCVGKEFHEMQSLYGVNFPVTSTNHLNPHFQNNSITQQAHFTSHNSQSQFSGSFLDELNSCPAPPTTLADVVATIGSSSLSPTTLSEVVTTISSSAPSDLMPPHSQQTLGITIKSEPLDV